MIKVPAYLVSKIKVRLLSTTSLLQTYADETITIEAHQLTLADPTTTMQEVKLLQESILTTTYQLPMPTVKLPYQRG